MNHDLEKVRSVRKIRANWTEQRVQRIATGIKEQRDADQIGLAARRDLNALNGHIVYGPERIRAGSLTATFGVAMLLIAAVLLFYANRVDDAPSILWYGIVATFAVAVWLIFAGLSLRMREYLPYRLTATLVEEALDLRMHFGPDVVRERSALWEQIAYVAHLLEASLMFLVTFAGLSIFLPFNAAIVAAVVLGFIVSVVIFSVSSAQGDHLSRLRARRIYRNLVTTGVAADAELAGRIRAKLKLRTDGNYSRITIADYAGVLILIGGVTVFVVAIAVARVLLAPTPDTLTVLISAVLGFATIVVLVCVVLIEGKQHSVLGVDGERAARILGRFPTVDSLDSFHRAQAEANEAWMHARLRRVQALYRDRRAAADPLTQTDDLVFDIQNPKTVAVVEHPTTAQAESATAESVLAVTERPTTSQGGSPSTGPTVVAMERPTTSQAGSTAASGR